MTVFNISRTNSISAEQMKPLQLELNHNKISGNRGKRKVARKKKRECH